MLLLSIGSSICFHKVFPGSTSVLVISPDSRTGIPHQALMGLVPERRILTSAFIARSRVSMKSI